MVEKEKNEERCSVCGEEIEPAGRVWKMPPWYVQLTALVGISAGIGVFFLVGKVIGYLWEVIF